MLEEKKSEVTDAKLMLFVLTDGEQNAGTSLGRTYPIVEGLQVPFYTIAYNYSSTADLEKLSGACEAACIKADSANVVNQLRSLFQVNL